MEGKRGGRDGGRWRWRYDCDDQSLRLLRNTIGVSEEQLKEFTASFR